MPARLRDAKCVIIRFCQEGLRVCVRVCVCVCRRNVYLFFFIFKRMNTLTANLFFLSCGFVLRTDPGELFEGMRQVGRLLRQSLEENQETHSSTKTGSAPAGSRWKHTKPTNTVITSLGIEEKKEKKKDSTYTQFVNIKQAY
ncbi:hypothetical protein PAMA_019721 [Pampus argenteus]